jgi:glucose-1-phosphate thymidylyltransferase
MKAIVLAAGYAKRLYPLTLHQPKPLLSVGGRPILEHLLSKIQNIEAIDQTYIVTNAKFYEQFCDWVKKSSFRSCIILNDGTLENDHRLGAIGDIQFVLRSQKISDDILILAGDNLFEFDLADFVRFYKERGTSVACYELENLQLASQYGVLQLDDHGQILKFWEKPAQPLSRLISTGVYGYTRSDLEQMALYLKEGGNPDAPGHFLEWLANRKPVYGFIIPGRWFDIGDLESYHQADKIYKIVDHKEKAE